MSDISSWQDSELICLVFRIRKIIPEDEVDFKDTAYQAKLPMLARSTATQAVKNNIRSTELAADKSLILAQQKVYKRKKSPGRLQL